PITYSIEIQESIPKFYLTEIIKAFTTWQTATEDKISFKQIKDNANIKIVFRQNNIPSADTQNKTIIAYTMPDIDADKLVSMQIKFNVKDPFGNYFSEQFIYDTALHEIAHALGVMGHSDFPDDILYLYSNGEQAKNENIPLLTQRDINTVNLLYEIKPEITNNYDGKFKYHPMIVIGKDIDIANAKEREAEIYIETAPNLPTGYIDLAEAKISMNDYKSAVKCLKKALSLSDSKKMQALILHNLAVVNFLDTNYQESLNYIQKSLDMNYTEESLHILAKIYSNLREDKNAISIYDKLIDNNPHNIDYAIELTNIYVKNYQYINAVKVLKKYKKFNPKEKNNERFKPYGVLNLFSN
ncbi:matrixin family metalloprotease, partial [bacterium]|nr:matrixin family metalloprotease [bacterium]